MQALIFSRKYEINIKNSIASLFSVSYLNYDRRQPPSSKWLPPETNKRYLFKLCVGSGLKLVQALKNTATLLCLSEKIQGNS